MGEMEGMIEVLLRDLTHPRRRRRPFPNIAELKLEGQDWIQDEDGGKLLAEFARRVRELPPLPKAADIWISIYGSQITLKLPREFCQLVVDTGLQVTIDYND